MKLSHLAILMTLLSLVGCTASMHPNYSKVYYKQVVSVEKNQEIMQRFSQQGLVNAATSIDPFGRVELSGSYENEKEVELALSIARSVVGNDAVSDVRPKQIKQKDWEVSASRGFASFIEDLAKKYKMSVDVERSGENNLIGVSDIGLDGLSQFASGSSNPTQNAIEFYRSAASIIFGSSAEKNNRKKILIVGHTDDVGSSKANVELSEQRAHSVGAIFEKSGIASDQILYQGAGEYYPISDNRLDEGRAKNRRVEIIDLTDDKALALYLINRRPNIAFFRPAADESKNTSVVKQNNASRPDTKTAQVKEADRKDKKVDVANKIKIKPSKEAKNIDTKLLADHSINFGGVPLTSSNSWLNVSLPPPSKFAFSGLISEANAGSIDMSALRSCYMDKPRNVGVVKSFKDSKTYSQVDYWDGLTASTWFETVGGNLVVINRVGVLKDGAIPANKPNLNVYVNYNSKINSDPSPDLSLNPEVNTYVVTEGLLYRVFLGGERGMECMDLLMPSKRLFSAKAGKLIYDNKGEKYVVDYVPKLQSTRR